MPLYTFRNKTTGEIVKTTDPGRALIGKWRHMSTFKGPVLRGLAARAPYFHNESPRRPIRPSTSQHAVHARPDARKKPTSSCSCAPSEGLSATIVRTGIRTLPRAVARFSHKWLNRAGQRLAHQGISGVPFHDNANPP